jgi:hypothetical protein
MITRNQKPARKHDKDPKPSFSTILLTSGLLISLVTGVFNFFNNRENNNRLLDLETRKQELQINTDRWKSLYDTYQKLREIQPPLITADNFRKAITREGIDFNSLADTSTHRWMNVLKEFWRIWPLLDDQSQQYIGELLSKEDQLSDKAIIELQNPNRTSQTENAILLELVSLRAEIEKTVIDVIQKQMRASRKGSWGATE